LAGNLAVPVWSIIDEEHPHTPDIHKFSETQMGILHRRGP
jgi:hypothetical protein